MVANITNYVSSTINRGDVLSPTEFYSINSMILGILKDYRYSSIKANNIALQSHKTNYDDPHNTMGSLFPDIVNRVYSFYSTMTDTPMSLYDFNTTVVPSVSFLELCHRIVLNRYLYNSIKSGNTTLTTTFLNIPNDVFRTDNPDTVTKVTFSNSFSNEAQFNQYGIASTTTPPNLIQTATDLSLPSDRLKPLFSTSASNPYFPGLSPENDYTISVESNAKWYTVLMQVVWTPQVNTDIFTIGTIDALLTVYMTSKRAINVKYNNIVLFTTDIPVADGRISIEFSTSGSLAVKTVVSGIVYTYAFNLPIPELLTTEQGEYIVTEDGYFIPLENNSGIHWDWSYESNKQLRVKLGLESTTARGTWNNVSITNSNALRDNNGEPLLSENGYVLTSEGITGYDFGVGACSLRELSLYKGTATYPYAA
jgi:hypothetical protein